MSSFAIYNYQFAKIIKRAKEQSFDGFGSVVMDAETAFQHKQEIFGYLFEKDYEAEKESEIIKFINGRSDKVFVHQHLMPPTDGMIVMRVANVRSASYMNKEFNEDHVDDYQNCIVIIDNRSGIQRILIENRKRAFQDVKQVANILSYTFNQLLQQYSLKIELMHLQFRESRESFNSDLDWSFKANEGGRVRLDENDERQRALIEYMMEDVGSNNIKLYPNHDKRKAIIVGKDSFAAIGISETIIKRLEEDVRKGELFKSKALDEIKIKTKTRIDL